MAACVRLEQPCGVPLGDQSSTLAGTPEVNANDDPRPSFGQRGGDAGCAASLPNVSPPQLAPLTAREQRAAAFLHRGWVADLLMAAAAAGLGASGYGLVRGYCQPDPFGPQPGDNGVLPTARS